MISITDKDFINGILETEKECGRSSSRSNKKLKILHPLLAKLIIGCDNNWFDWSFKCLTENNTSEVEVTFGENNTIRCDIAIYYRGVLCGIFLVKHIYCSVNKNKKNLFESITGECIHLDSGNIPVFEVLVLPDKTPVFSKDRVSSFEIPNLDLWYPFSHKGKSETNIDKMFIYSFSLPSTCETATTREEYDEKIQEIDFISKSDRYSGKFGDLVIYNDETKFARECNLRMKKHYCKTTGFAK